MKMIERGDLESDPGTSAHPASTLAPQFLSHASIDFLAREMS